jgi:two-component system chemotaxis response regulator CheY
MPTQRRPNLILLVDDDEGINYINKRLLEIHGLGNTIITFVSAKDALSYLQDAYITRSPLPELLFLDIMMPLVNGFEFLEEFDKME